LFASFSKQLFFTFFRRKIRDFSIYP